MRAIVSGHGTAKLYQGDAVAFLHTLDDESVDLSFTSPPYCIGKAYDSSLRPQDFLAEHERILPILERKIKPGGSMCWQVGFHCTRGEVVPLDALIYVAAAKYPSLHLRNRVIWTFAHGAHASKRFSGRYETVLWFTKGHNYTFNLDSVRVPQLYPGKRHYKGPNKGKWSGNPLGKNPGDVWEIPNVKARHPEKTDHPCQFPTALARRFIRALTPTGGLVIDPYFGSGSAAVSALLEGRNFSGSELEAQYVGIAESRLIALGEDRLNIREDTPARKPKTGESVAQTPPHFRHYSETGIQHG